MLAYLFHPSYNSEGKLKSIWEEERQNMYKKYGETIDLNA